MSGMLRAGVWRVQLTSGGELRINNSAGQPVYTFDSASGAEFSLPLTLKTNAGGIYQGTGTFASPTTGLKIYSTGTAPNVIGRLTTYSGGVDRKSTSTRLGELDSRAAAWSRWTRRHHHHARSRAQLPIPSTPMRLRRGQRHRRAVRLHAAAATAK